MYFKLLQRCLPVYVISASDSGECMIFIMVAQLSQTWLNKLF